MRRGLRFVRFGLWQLSRYGGLCSLLAASGCTYTAAVTQTNVPRERGHVVEASVKKNLIFLINSDNDNVMQLRSKLAEKCPNGRVLGILTKDLRTVYFPIIWMAYETSAMGYCVAAGASADEGSSAGRDWATAPAPADTDDVELSGSGVLP